MRMNQYALSIFSCWIKVLGVFFVLTPRSDTHMLLSLHSHLFSTLCLGRLFVLFPVYSACSSDSNSVHHPVFHSLNPANQNVSHRFWDCGFATCAGESIMGSFLFFSYCTNCGTIRVNYINVLGVRSFQPWAAMLVIRENSFSLNIKTILSSTKFNKVVITWATEVAITLNMDVYSQADVVELLKV